MDKVRGVRGAGRGVVRGEGGARGASADMRRAVETPAADIDSKQLGLCSRNTLYRWRIKDNVKMEKTGCSFLVYLIIYELF